MGRFRYSVMKLSRMGKVVQGGGCRDGKRSDSLERRRGKRGGVFAEMFLNEK
jgi:hypothetical protein